MPPTRRASSRRWPSRPSCGRAWSACVPRVCRIATRSRRSGCPSCPMRCACGSRRWRAPPRHGRPASRRWARAWARPSRVKPHRRRPVTCMRCRRGGSRGRRCGSPRRSWPVRSAPAWSSSSRPAVSGQAWPVAARRSPRPARRSRGSAWPPIISSSTRATRSRTSSPIRRCPRRSSARSAATTASACACRTCAWPASRSRPSIACATTASRSCRSSTCPNTARPSRSA